MCGSLLYGKATSGPEQRVWQLPVQEIIRPPLLYTPAKVQNIVCVAAPCTRLPVQEIIRPPLLYTPAKVQNSVCVAASCTRNSKAASALHASQGPEQRVCGSLLYGKATSALHASQGSEQRVCGSLLYKKK